MLIINKIKNYFRVFGFKQTVLKLFRYADEKIHTDKNGVYTPTVREKRFIKLKSQQVYIFSDKQYSGNDELSSRCSRFFNSVGCAVNYYFFCENIDREKNPPLCIYDKFTAKRIKEISFEDSVVVLDTEGDMRLPLLYKAKNEKCFLIDISCGAEKISVAALCDSLNILKGLNRCPDRFFDNISVVILNYNNKNVIFNCLDTLIKYNGKYKYEIIVVDNQSTDGSFEEICEKYNNVKIYRNEKNGCSSGRNIGIMNSTKEYVLFLDSDQWVLHGNWLDAYLDLLEKDCNIGAIGWTGGWFNRKGYSYHTVNNFTYGYMPPKVLCRRDIGYLGTGGMMVSKRLLDDIGGFDLNYDPTCYEDTDISLEIRNKGKEIYYCPYLGVGHLPHQTTKSGSEGHEKLIKAKGDYFISKWRLKNPKLLNFVK